MGGPYTDEYAALLARAEAAEVERDEMRAKLEQGGGNRRRDASGWAAAVLFLGSSSFLFYCSMTGCLVPYGPRSGAVDGGEVEHVPPEVAVVGVAIGDAVILDPARAERVYAAFELSSATCIIVTSDAREGNGLQLWQTGGSSPLMELGRTAEHHRQFELRLPGGRYRVRHTGTDVPAIISVAECNP